MSTNQIPTTSASVDLYWLPLGAGDNMHCVRRNGRIFEAIAARYERRARCDLYHSALEIHLGADRFVIEMAPVWRTDEPDRGVVCEGSVGLRWLGHSRFFRYEVRSWRNGVIPDVTEAVDSPQRLSADEFQAAQLLALAPTFPTATWGRDELRAGEMWNSNSLIAWLLARSGHDVQVIGPPRTRPRAGLERRPGRRSTNARSASQLAGPGRGAASSLNRREGCAGRGPFTEA